jgi:DNA-binding NtrC family response regulator
LERAAHNESGIAGLSPEVERLFAAYHWPGNVRELANVIERAIPFTDGDKITLDSLPEALRNASKGTASGPVGVLAADENFSDLPFKDAKERLIDAFERQYLVDLLDRNGGNISRAARSAQMDRKSIARLLRKHDISAR